MGKKSKKKVQWRRLSLNELQSNESSSKRRQRKTPEREVKDDERTVWDGRHQSAQNDHSTGTNKRGPPSGEELPDARFHRQHQDDEFSNYNNHNNSQRFTKNFYDRRFQNNGLPHNNNVNNGNNNHHHGMNGVAFQNGIPQHERYDPSNYHGGYNNRGGGMDRPYRNFDRDRSRYYNNYPASPFERYGRDGGCNAQNGPMVPNGPMGPNGQNGFYHDRRRPMYRMNGRPTNGYPSNYAGGGGGSPSMRRRWSNGDEPPYPFPPRNPPSYHAGNSGNQRYRDGSHCGTGHDSGGSNGYEGGSSETQSEPEERPPLHQPVQSILIDNDQYTKIQTPRQEVIFKKNSGGGGGSPPCPTPPSRSQSLTTDRPPYHKADSSKRAGSTTALSRNKKNSKLESNNKSTPGNSSNKKQNSNRRGDMIQSKKGGNQTDAGRVRTGKENNSKGGDGGKVGSKKHSVRADRNATSVKQDTDETQSDNPPVREDDEDDCPESDDDEDEEELYQQEEYSYQQDYPYQQDMQAGVIMQQCYPGGPMVSIPVHWTSFLDPSLIPGDTALTPLDPAFTHLLDPSFKPLDPAKWDNTDPEAGPSIIPETVIPVQHDASGCPVTVQVNIDENGIPIKIEPSAFTVQLSSLGQQHHHHPSCQMAGMDLGLPLHFAPYAEENHRNPHFEYKFDDGLEKRLEQKIDEELAKHYSDEEDETEKGDDSKPQKGERRDSRDCEETSYDSQYASMSEGSSLPTSPAGELSDSPSTCPPNTPSETEMGEGATPSILKSSATPLRETSPNSCTSTLAANTGSSISMSSASTLCASSSSSSSTLVSLSSSPVNSGNPSKETSPSSPRQALRTEERAGSSSPLADQRETDLLSDDDKRPNDVMDESKNEKNVEPIAEMPAERYEFKEEETSTGANCNLMKNENMPALELSDSKEKTEMNTIEVSISKTTVDEVKEIVSTPSSEHSSEEDFVQNSVENAPVDSPQDNTMSEGEAMTKEKTVTGEEMAKDANSAAVSGDNLDIDQQPVPGESAATQDGDPESSPDGQEMTVTVKPGYVMVPILTPYYDPSVLYGYQMMSNDGHVEHSHYQNSHTSKKKKKKHNRRRGMENNSPSYMDSDMYAGEPYVATPDGYLMPMDASMCSYGMSGSMPYLHPMQQYQYEMLQQQMVGQQYQQSNDEGFVSVEHSPFLPDIADSPIDQSPDAKQLSGAENKFGKLHETERQQIKEVLDDNKTPTAGETCGADLSDSGVSETEEVPKNIKTSHLESLVTDPESPDTVETVQNQRDVEENLTSSQSNNLSSSTTDQHEATEFESDLLVDVNDDTTNNQEHQNTHHTINDKETSNVIVADSQIELMSTSIFYTNSTISINEMESEHNNNCNNGKDDPSKSIVQEMESEESLFSSPNTVEMAKLESHPKSSLANDNSLDANETITEDDSAILNCSLVSDQSVLMQISSAMVDSECCDAYLNNDECVFQNETATSIQDSLNNTLDCKEVSSSEQCISNQSFSLVKQESLSLDEQDNSDLSSDISLNDGVTDEMVVELKEEMTLAQSLLETRISSTCTKKIDLQESSNAKYESSVLKDLKVTEAVRRWIRDVTPEKAFTLHTEEGKSTLMDCRLSEASEEDEYFEDDVVDPGGGGKNEFVSHKPALDAMVKEGTSTDELSKNVRGNPFGVLSSDSDCSVKFTKRVATCSTSSDALDDYDGSSSVSSLSHGPLFSPPSSQIISQSSSRTITPNRSLECDREEVDLRACTCDPSGYRKYYQLAAEVDDSPICTPRPMSPDEEINSSTGSRVPLLTTEMNKADKCAIHSSPHHESCIYPLPCNCSPSCHSILPSSHDKALASPISSCSSGLGSSLASTPAISPQHPPLRHPHSSPRIPFMLLPPNMRAESGSASLNTIHCCSLM